MLHGCQCFLHVLNAKFWLQAVPLYLSEISPAHARGTLNIMFQMATTIGIWAAQWINYGTQHMHPHGWRLSMGLAIVPGLILFLGSLIIPDTPNSLVNRGKVEQARRTLERVRGTAAVDAEFADIVEAVENGKRVNKFAIFQKKYRPVLVRKLLFGMTIWSSRLLFNAAQLLCLSCSAERVHLAMSHFSSICSWLLSVGMHIQRVHAVMSLQYAGADIIFCDCRLVQC